MAKQSKPGKERKPLTPVLRRHGSVCVAAACLGYSLMLTGCTGMNHSSVGGADPLVGGAPAKVAAGTPSATTASASPEATASTPPIPIPIASTSPAVLASSTPRSLQGGNDLRIASPRTSPADAWNRQPGSGLAAASNPSPKAYAEATLPADGSGSLASASAGVKQEPLPIVSPVSLPAASREPPTVDQLYVQLNSRGMLYKDLKQNPDTGEWIFVCIVPKKSDPNVRRTYTGRAKDSLEAVRAVLEQIDKDQ